VSRPQPHVIEHEFRREIEQRASRRPSSGRWQRSQQLLDPTLKDCDALTGRGY